MVLTTIVTGAYKPTYNWGHHFVQKAIEHGHLEIVDLPIKNGDFPYLY